jgi:hypothetical protein
MAEVMLRLFAQQSAELSELHARQRANMAGLLQQGYQARGGKLAPAYYIGSESAETEEQAEFEWDYGIQKESTLHQGFQGNTQEQSNFEHEADALGGGSVSATGGVGCEQFECTALGKAALDHTAAWTTASTSAPALAKRGVTEEQLERVAPGGNKIDKQSESQFGQVQERLLQGGLAPTSHPPRAVTGCAKLPRLGGGGKVTKKDQHTRPWSPR